MIEFPDEQSVPLIGTVTRSVITHDLEQAGGAIGLQRQHQAVAQIASRPCAGASARFPARPSLRRLCYLLFRAHQFRGLRRVKDDPDILSDNLAILVAKQPLSTRIPRW